MRFVLDLLYLLIAVGISPIVIYRAIKHKRYRTGWAHRLGKVPPARSGKKCIWLHAVSVGEVNAAKSIISELEDKFGDHEIVVSTTTDTGFARANALFGEKFQIFYFPFDFSLIMSRAFHRIQPVLCLLMELEVWPNFVRIAQNMNVPIVIVNGRISDKSFFRYKKIKPLARKIFRKVTLVLAQTEQYAEYFRELGCPDKKVIVTGSLKYDTAQISDKVEGSELLAEELNIGSDHLWVAGATGPGEEKILLDVYNDLRQQNGFKNLRLAIVPRKPERFDEVAQIITDAGFDFLRYSAIKNSKLKTKNLKLPVILGDTMGDLRKFYCLATIIFVGRSLVPMGGSDMIEATALGKCTIFGPFAFNFQQTVDALIEDTGSIMVKDKEDLLRTMQKCLAEPDYAKKIAGNGRETIRKNQGATKKTIEQIAELLENA